MKQILYWPLQYLDRTPMYSVIMQVLFLTYALAVVGSVFGYIGFTSIELLASGGVIMGTALLMNYACALVTKVPLQHYSSVITALILILLIMPSAVGVDLFYAAVITAIAIASKYVLIYKKQHLVNPAAAGLVLGALFGFGGGVWWVASSFLFVPIIIGGLLVAEKVKRLDMVAVFLSAAFALHIISMWQQSIPTSELITTFFVSYPFVFLGFFMLTEPFTMPSQKQARYVYAVVVASATILPSLGPIGMSPELALVIGNLVLAPWGQRQKLILALSSMRPVTSSVYEFSFPKPKDFTFIAGQYVEWMVPHQSSDNRGTRRYFTIVSAPEDDELRLAFKFPEKASTYKQAMMKLKPGDIVVASQRSGDFVLPTAMDSKLGFIAGGIGVTPFVSHVTSMARRGEKRDVATIYCTATESDLAYASLLSAAGQLIPVIGSGAVPEGAESGYLTTDIIMRRVPDYASRTWYISGPPKMVDSAYGILRGLKVPVGQIKRDFFPGLA